MVKEQQPVKLDELAIGPTPEDLAELKEVVLKKISNKQVKKAIRALTKHYKVKKQELIESSEKKELFNEEEDEIDETKEIDFERFPIERKSSRCFYLTFSLNKLSEKFTYTLKGRRINVPFPLEKATSDLDICLITTEDDEEKMKALVKAAKDNKELNKEEQSSLEGIKRVLTRQKVLKIYPGPKKKKDLSMLHDMFLCDTRIAEAMPKTLGKYFLKGAKQFRTVRLIPKDFQYIPDYLPRKEASKPVITESLKEIAENLKYTVEGVYFYPRGSCVTIKTGRMGMTEEQIYQNAVEVIAAVAGWTKDSGGFSNILSVSLKTGNSIALPLFASLPDLSTLSKDDVVKDDDKLSKILLKRKALRQERKRKRRKLVVNIS